MIDREVGRFPRPSLKRNLRNESPEQWLANARRIGEKIESRKGKNIYVGFVDHLRPAKD